MCNRLLFVSYLVLLITLNAFRVNGQSDWKSYGKIYEDNYVKVEVQFKVYDDACQGIGKNSIYRYKFSGKERGSDLWLNWKFDYKDCQGQIISYRAFVNIGKFEDEGLIEDMDWSFNGDELLTPFYDVTTSKVLNTNTPRTTLVSSKPATGITGDDEVVSNAAVELKVQGGFLSRGAKWVWYKEGCGIKQIGEGEKITVIPSVNTTYFVRAEDKSRITPCVSKSININNESKAADKIIGRELICEGTSTTLSITGGRLGLNAKWIWYKGACNGTKIGEGESIVINPSERTLYMVRAEGSSNITECRSFTVDITDFSIKPESINAVDILCGNEEVTLSVNGGKLADKAEWVWSRSVAGKSEVIGKGNSIRVASTDATAIYEVRGEGICNRTDAVGKIIKVKEVSKPAATINVPAITKKRQTVQLSVSGGHLGYGAKWIWTKDDRNGKIIGEGSILKYKVKKKTTVFVKAVGECNTTSSTSANLSLPYKYSAASFSDQFLNVGVTANAPYAIVEHPTITLSIGRGKGIGWYLRGKYTISDQQEPILKTTNSRVINYSKPTYYKYNGKVVSKRTAYSAGLFFGKTLAFYVGAGYGSYDVYWGIDEFNYSSNDKTGSDYAKNTSATTAGIETEAGIILRLGKFNMMGGINTISLKHIDATAGIGINF